MRRGWRTRKGAGGPHNHEWSIMKIGKEREHVILSRLSNEMNHAGNMEDEGNETDKETILSDMPTAMQAQDEAVGATDQGNLVESRKREKGTVNHLLFEVRREFKLGFVQERQCVSSRKAWK
mmetsp:Transcript_7081/g.13941  ORF Transcript_7081/g.13941 Transcript_7081/m.13941 type:complete len:122 (-) Transcript_7081:544-909(-)